MPRALVPYDDRRGASGNADRRTAHGNSERLLNGLNLLNGDWGSSRAVTPTLREHVELEGAEPTFRFDTQRRPDITLVAESALQLQLGVRYRS